MTELNQAVQEHATGDLRTAVWPDSRQIVGVLALISAVLTMLIVSVPGYSLLIVGGLWLIVGLAWIAAILASLGNRTGSRRVPWSLAIAPAVLLLTWAIASAGLPLMARFTLSRAAFEQLGDRGLSYEASAPAGLYVVCCFERTDFGYQFGVSEGLNVIWGFAYSPDGRPTGRDIDSGGTTNLQEGENAYRHLDGPWYIWEFVFT